MDDTNGSNKVAQQQQEQQELSTNDIEQQKAQQPVYPDLDLSKIELDCQLSYSSSKPTRVLSIQQQRSTTNSEQNEGKNIWKVVVKHEARTFEELSVLPGMLIYVIKQFADYLYGKIIGHENMSMAQQYGLIPKYCAQSLADMLAAAVADSAHRLNSSTEAGVAGSLGQDVKRRKSQITAL